MYHNTTHSSGAEVKKFRHKAKSQEEALKRFFRSNWSLTFTASEVMNACLMEGRLELLTPITSVRRAMSNLTTDGVIFKTTTQRKGPYGRPEYAYKLTDTQMDMFS